MILKILLSGVLLFCAGVLWASESGWREDFSRTKLENEQLIPMDWAFGGSRMGAPSTRFYVKDCAELKKPILVVDSRRSTGALMCRPSDRNADLSKTPILRWRWRVKSLPPGGDGRGAKVDDQAIAIYIGGPGTFSQKSIAYRWETETPLNTTGKITYGLGALTVNWICIRNKETTLGAWHEETRDIAADYQKYYGHVPERFVISVCGNSQYSKSDTIAEVEFLELVPRSKIEAPAPQLLADQTQP
jgi:hypothetical protein